MARKNALGEEYKIDIAPEMFNDSFYPHLQTIHRYEIYYGGSGSGKSFFIAHKLALQLTLIEGRNLICLRKQGSDARDSCYAEMYAAMDEFRLLDLWDVVEHPMPRMTNRINGNVIAFSGLDSIEDIKSVRFKKGRLTDVWYEEATQEQEAANIREIDRRLRDPKHKCRIILSFNPVAATHWIKNWMEVEQKGTDIMILKTTYKDNKFIDKEYIQVLERYRITDPYSYMVYALGNWGTTGQSVFNANAINQRLMQLLERKERRAEFQFKLKAHEDESFDIEAEIFNNPDGETFIYKDPERGRPYVLAFDTAGEGSDFYAGHVLDNITGEQVAVFHSPRMPKECIQQIYCLGKHYNWALLCPEVNFDSYPLQKLQEWQYPRIAIRELPKDRIDARIEAKQGFRTTSENRQRVLTDLQGWMTDNVDCINDINTLNEMLTFTRQPRKLKGIFWAAENGAHDDLVIALAIALQIRSQQVAFVEEERKPLEGMWFPEELDFLVDQGMISKKEAKDHNARVMSELGMAHTAPRGGSNRYAR
jgi:phage terminase large subunit